MFFKNFPTIPYRISPTESVVVQDIIRAVQIDPKLKNESIFFFSYRIEDNETPEMISHKFYGSTAYHWVLMVLNERFDPYDDFPKSDRILRKHCESKYADILGVHHYVDPLYGQPTDEFNTEKIVVTNLEYETTLNEKKRHIKILKPEVLSEFVGRYIGTITT
jgi:Base plate wedge protein 53